jgi:predicted amidophosphoribosyltransferase
LLRPGLAGLPLGWIAATPCPICRRPLAPLDSPLAACADCRSRLSLPPGGVRGKEPLLWWGAGIYDGDLRRLMLGLRRHPKEVTVGALVRVLAEGQPQWRRRPLLVPVPSWKRQGNPLPTLVCRQLGRQLGYRSADLLERSRPVLGQHHLKRTMRLSNQKGAFRCRRGPRPGEALGRPILIVDDILTSGATGCSAAEALESLGWQVVGLLCLARTPQGRSCSGR